MQIKHLRALLLCIIFCYAYSSHAASINLRDQDFTLPHDADFVTTINTFTAPRTITLPQGASFDGSTIQFFDTARVVNGTNYITFVPAGTDLLNGTTSFIVTTPYSNITFVRSPSGWYASSPANMQSLVSCGGIDDTAAINTALSALNNATIIGSCTVTATISPPSNSTIQGLDQNSTINLVSASTSRIIDMTSRTLVRVANLNLGGSGAQAGNEFIRFQNTTNSILENVNVTSPPASVNGSIVLSQTSTGNKIIGGSVINSAGSAITLTGPNVTGNQIVGTRFSGSVLFNVFLTGTLPTGGPNENLIQSTYGVSSGVEGIALQSGAFHNRINTNYIEAAGDNGISISGYRNVISSNTLIRNQKAGIWIWGGQNSITGNIGINNNQSVASWACIGVNGNFGGTGQNNTITANVCDDDQAVPTQLGILQLIPGYTAWASSQAITTGNYRINGLNIYQAINSGTSGATPPTCTSGTCSDGTITWTYINSYLGSATTLTTLSGNVVSRFSGANAYAYSGYTSLNFGQGSINMTLGTGTPEAALTGSVGNLYLRSNGGAGTTFYVKESGTGNTGWIAK